VLSREAKVKASHLGFGFEEYGQQGVVVLKGDVGRRQRLWRCSTPIPKGPFEVLDPGVLPAFIPRRGRVAEPVGMKASGPKGSGFDKLRLGAFGGAGA
jgi:hypothetical protein